MSLPTLIEYVAPVPPQRDLPTNKAPWQLDPARTAVLVHDLQRYFLRVYDAECPALETAIAATERIIAAARAAGVPVFYTAQTGEHVDRGLQADLWGPGMAPTREHTEIWPRIAPVSGDVVLDKRRYSAFAHSDFAERLSAAGRDQLIITGVYAHIGITATAFDAFQREVQPFVVADGVADFGADQHRRALEQIAGCCGVVALADSVLEALGAAASGWESILRLALRRILEEESLSAAYADESRDLFEIGLDSLRAFDLLDELADAGVDVDYGEFTRNATLAYLREQGALVTA